MRDFIGKVVFTVLLILAFSSGIAIDHYFLTDEAEIVKKHIKDSKKDSTLIIKTEIIKPDPFTEKKIKGEIRKEKDNADEPTVSTVEFHGKNFDAFLEVESLGLISARIDSINIRPPEFIHTDSTWNVKETIVISETWYEKVIGNNWVDYVTRLGFLVAAYKVIKGDWR